MPSLFRRPSPAPDAEPAAEAAPADGGPAPKGYTPSKRELGVATPKRAEAQKRRPAEPPPGDRKEALRRSRERRKEQRAEAMAGMRRGDDRYLTARDRGPERALVRDLVDARRTAGTWFFGGALLVLIGSSTQMPLIVQVIANYVWLALALAVVLDSVLIARRIGKRVRAEFPQTTQRVGGLMFYGIMRGLTFRRMRMPSPRVDLGEHV
ncbi:hypothetical protein GCM10010123_13130 [Pilimelia anulata]|uniref:DUF3043 domain-containing protein n=1 Tax=Pilimelia anulata TaxID=53371 RepID=A0A8J3F843_9ACTN|nr:DUF3043 domain-containing protein [Pilimelia anulata]GGJ84856.1 hypothetical protein GCM10010123_13130 [Pilimelia anulata]